MSAPEPTLFDRLIRQAKENPIIAWSLFVGLAITTVLTFVKLIVGFYPFDSNSDPDPVVVENGWSDHVSFKSYVEGAMTSATTELRRNDYAASMRGQRVIWDGWVAEVYDEGSTSPGGSTVALKLEFKRGGKVALFHFGAAQRADTLQLEAGDFVGLSGVVDKGDMDVVHLVDSRVYITTDIRAKKAQ